MLDSACRNKSARHPRELFFHYQETWQVGSPMNIGRRLAPQVFWPIPWSWAPAGSPRNPHHVDLHLDAPQQAFAPAPGGETPAARAGDARNNFAMNSATRSFWHRQSVAGVATPKRASAAVSSRSRWQTSLYPWHLTKQRGMRLRTCLWAITLAWAGVVLFIIPTEWQGLQLNNSQIKDSVGQK